MFRYDDDIHFIYRDPDGEVQYVELDKFVGAIEGFCRREPWQRDDNPALEHMVRQVPYIWQFLRNEKHVRAFIQLSKNEEENRKAEVHLFKLSL